ncbi:hypothetical protein CU633_20970 [Bacillus sp. V3-13]|uniref:DUF998 domain-containing protein n=1 Tax=Bacillus sp. V3-13 TaxID=2053728 RepID=UPI000C75F1B8|nr:DUF998 domain-containing protein [Bacillus sp. V3-13]PLR75438.1 hypothetical protein CU633_20970 [Bacillus sp. V3-13]
MKAVKFLPLFAVVSPIIFTLTWFILGFISKGYTIYGVRIEPYSAITQPISGLGMGSTAIIMNSSFILSGILLFAGIIGIFLNIREKGRVSIRRASIALLILSPIGLIVCGMFDLESTLLHSVGFLLSTGTTIVSFLIAGLYFRGIPRLRKLGSGLIVGSPLTLILVILFFINFDPVGAGEGHGIAGIVSRLLAVEVLFWFAAMGLLTFNYTSTETRRSS